MQRQSDYYFDLALRLAQVRAEELRNESLQTTTVQSLNDRGIVSEKGSVFSPLHEETK